MRAQSLKSFSKRASNSCDFGGGVLGVGAKEMVEPREQSFGGDGVTLWGGHHGEAAEESIIPVFVLLDHIFEEGLAFNLVTDADVGAENLDGVVGAEGGEFADSRVLTARVQLRQAVNIRGAVPFALEFVGFKTTLAALIHVEDGGFVGSLRSLGEKRDVIKVGLGDDPASESAVDFFEDGVDDEGEEDGASDSSLASAGFRGDDVFGVGAGV